MARLSSFRVLSSIHTCMYGPGWWWGGGGGGRQLDKCEIRRTMHVFRLWISHFLLLNLHVMRFNTCTCNNQHYYIIIHHYNYIIL